MTKDEALKLAKTWFERNTYGDEAVEVYEAIEQALAAPVQKPAFYGFMDEENCCVHICYTPWAPRMTDGKLPTAYYTTPPAQPAPTVQEPVAIGWDTKTDTPIMGYTTPPAAQRQWVGLTDDDKLTVRRMPWETLGDLMDNIEAKLKEKNT